MLRTALYLLSVASCAVASPVHSQEATSTKVLGDKPSATEEPVSAYDWSKGWETKYPIHQSCNATLKGQLERALDETVQLAEHARDHLLRFGHESEFVKKYFGNGTTAGPIGWYDRVVAADKTGITFRCDDPDKNCATQDGWAGHWRGDNATDETVICGRSFEIRRHLDSVCGLGYTVAASPLNTFWATDLLHRVLHLPRISEGIVDHFAEDYADAISQAKEDPEKSGIDSDVLQYFAIDVWAYDIAAPGIGCTGEPEDDDESDDHKPTSTQTATATKTATAGKECHTHDDGTEHCT